METGESAFYIADPEEWAQLEELFYPWIEDIDDEDKDDYLPSWIDDRLVIGEIPRSGNYLLIPTTGTEVGKVFEFEHDGFEFIELAPSLSAFIGHVLDPNPRTLTNMASHMRFITDESGAQWWIRELRDNYGNVVTTHA